MNTSNKIKRPKIIATIINRNVNLNCNFFFIKKWVLLFIICFIPQGLILLLLNFTGIIYLVKGCDTFMFGPNFKVIYTSINNS